MTSRFHTPEAIDLAPLVDLALLDPTLTPEGFTQGCEAADQFGFATVCVYPYQVGRAAELLQRSKTRVGTVVGFPSGAHTCAVKLYEAEEATENGARELDVMVNLGWLKQGQWDLLHRELATICEHTGQTVKAILEVSLLTPEEVSQASDVCLDAGVAFLKTGTGWRGGATVEGVKLLAQVTRERAGVKAAGGIRTAAQALDLVQAGATRLGTSRGVEILQEYYHRGPGSS